jgi:hypothetical protein
MTTLMVSEVFSASNRNVMSGESIGLGETVKWWLNHHSWLYCRLSSVAVSVSWLHCNVCILYFFLRQCRRSFVEVFIEIV